MTIETATTAEQMQQDWDAVAAERKEPETSLSDNAGGTEAQKALEQTAAAADPAPRAQTPAKEPTTAEILAEVAALKEVNKTLQDELRRTSGRVSSLQSQLALGAKAASKVTEAPTKEAQAAAVKDPQEWEELKQDYPEWGVAIEKMIGARLEASLAKNPAQQNAAPGLDAAAVDTHVHGALMKRESDRIERTHKGWNRTVQTAEFLEWQQKQDDSVKALGESPYAEDAIKMLDLYMQAKERTDEAQAIQQGRQKKLNDAANGNPGRAAIPVSGKELTAKDLWDLEAKKTAQRHGR